MDTAMDFLGQHQYSCRSWGRKGDPKYPCSCGRDKATAQIEILQEALITVRDQYVGLTHSMEDDRAILKIIARALKTKN